MKKLVLFLVSILFARFGFVFACPSPANIDITPQFLPVGGVSSVSYVSFDIDPGDPSFHVTSEQVTTSPDPSSGATVSADGKTIRWNTAGIYTVTITVKITSTDGHTIEVKSATETKTVVVVGVTLSNTDEEDFFRSTTKILQFTVTPPGYADMLNVSLTGPDDVHWTGNYDLSSQKIDLANIIVVNNPTAWAINQASLTASATIAGLDYIWPFSKTVDFKKNMNDLRADFRDSFADTAATLLATQPGNQVATAVKDHMSSYMYEDSTEHFQVFSELRTREMSDEAKRGTDQAWGIALGTQIPRLIISQDINPYTLDESWTWQWNAKLEIITGEGQITIDTDLNLNYCPTTAGDLVKAANTYGWANLGFRPDGFIITDGLSADGHVGHAIYKAKLSPMLAGRIAPSPNDNTPPKMFHGGWLSFNGINFTISFWF
jgi:hypothetical protein